MTNTYTRYAIYFLPEEATPLYQFGASWLGWDSIAKQVLSDPKFPGLSEQVWHDTVSTPRRYGFHGTLKAPFSLAERASVADLEAVAEALSKRLARSKGPRLKLGQLGSFLALVLDGDASEMSALADACVQDFEPFRAALSDADIEKRRAFGLTPEQDANLLAWGYPHVFEQFRFHMTLSGRLSEDQMAQIKPMLSEATAPLCDEALDIGSLCLLGDPGQGQPFEFIRRFNLKG